VLRQQPTINNGSLGKNRQHGLPIGRAAPSPRINGGGGGSQVGSIYSPYASCGIKDATDEAMEHSRSLSTEELNAQIENLDIMIDDLQAMQHEYKGTNGRGGCT